VSFREVAWVLDNSPYKLADRLVHLVLAERTNVDHDHELWFSLAVVAKKANVSRRTVERSMAKMVEDGYLTVIEAAPGKPTRYRFTYDKLSQVPSGGCDIHDTKPATSTDSHLLLPKEDKNRADPMIGFDKFWSVYPRRNGRILGRGLCEKRWVKLPIEDKRLAYRGAQNYGADVKAGLTIAKDPDRWLRDKLWTDWLEAASAPTSGGTITTQEVPYDPEDWERRYGR
jgi:hypothetical protein